MIVVKCSGCGLSLKIPDEKAGHRVKCPKCEAVFRVPGGAVAQQASTPTAGSTDPGVQLDLHQTMPHTRPAASPASAPKRTTSELDDLAAAVGGRSKTERNLPPSPTPPAFHSERQPAVPPLLPSDEVKASHAEKADPLPQVDGGTKPSSHGRDVFRGDGWTIILCILGVVFLVMAGHDVYRILSSSYGFHEDNAIGATANAVQALNINVLFVGQVITAVLLFILAALKAILNHQRRIRQLQEE
jgi:hypothetical protein